jgi:hypothetical protein
MVRPIIVAGLAVLLPIILQAQGRGAIAVAAPHAMPVAPHVMAAVPNAVTHVGRPAGMQPVGGARTGVRAGTPHSRPTPHSGTGIASRNTVGLGGTRRHFDNDDRALRPGCSTVPGLGFDIPHLAATCGPEAVGAGRNGLQSSFFFPILDGGFMVSGAPGAVEDAAASEAQPSEDAEADVRERGRRVRVAREEPAPVPVSQADTTPARETSEYIFVRRDGTVFFAVAYAWEKGTLRYVTSEGLRRSVAGDSLDLNATQQFNEQRGLSFRLPA